MSNEIIFHLDGEKISSFSLEQNQEIKTIGSNSECHCSISQDSEVSARHLLLRFKDNRYEIYPLASCAIGNQKIQTSGWVAIPLGQYIYLSSRTSMQVIANQKAVPETPISQFSNPHNVFADLPEIQGYDAESLDISAAKNPAANWQPETDGLDDGYSETSSSSDFDNLQSLDISAMNNPVSNLGSDTGLLNDFSETSGSSDFDNLQSLDISGMNNPVAGLGASSNDITRDFPTDNFAKTGSSDFDNLQSLDISGMNNPVSGLGASSNDATRPFPKDNFAKTNDSSDFDNLQSLDISGMNNPVVPSPKERKTSRNTRSIKKTKEKVQALSQKIQERPDTTAFTRDEIGISSETILLDRYKIKKRIASGGMGTVYKAWDSQLKRKVAVKILSHENDPNSKTYKRFRMEAEAVGKLHHKNIIAIHDIGEFNKRPFFVMDYMSGKDLKAIIEKGDVNPREAMEWMLQIAEAVNYAHQSGILHRDIKPSNILVADNKAVLTDFGIAKDTSRLTQLTTAGESLGTPAYMSPEQAKGEDADYSSDVYSLGAVMYELFTGRPPFSGPPVEVLQKVCSIDPPPIYKFNPDIHNDAIVITTKAMCKEKPYRYPNASEMLNDIKRYLDGEIIQGKLPPGHLKIQRFVRHNRKAAMAIAGVIFVCIAIFFWYSYRSYQEEQQQIVAIREQLAKTQKLHIEAKNTRNVPLTKLFQILNDYSHILNLDPKNKEAKEGKFDVSMRMGDYALNNDRLEFASAMYFIAGQIASDLEKDRIGPKTKEVIDKKMSMQNTLDNLKKQKIREIGNAIEALRGKYVTEEDVKNSAFLLARFPDFESYLQNGEIRLGKDRNNPNIQKTIKLANEFLNRTLKRIRLSLRELDEVEKNIVDLLPYDSPSLSSKLLEKISSSNHDVSLLACRTVGLLKYKEAIPELLKQVSKDNQKIKNYALQSLIMLGAEQDIIDNIEARKISVDDLSGVKIWGTSLVVELLQKYPRYQPQLMPIIKNIQSAKLARYILDNFNTFSEEAQIVMLDTLGQLNDQEGLEYIKKILRGKDSSVRFAALKALTHYQGDKIFTTCLDIIENDSNTPQMREYAIKGLNRAENPKNIEKMLQLIKTAPELGDYVAVILLHNMEKSVLIEQLIAFLEEDSSNSARIPIIRILGALKTPKAIKVFHKILHSSSLSEQEEASKALAKIGNLASKELQASFPKEKRVQTQKQILEILGEIGSREDIEFLILSLQDLSLQDQAIESLAKIEDAVEMMLDVLDEKNEKVNEIKGKRRENITEGLSRVFGKMDASVTSVLVREFLKSETKQRRDNLILAFSHLGPEVAPYLRKMMLDKDIEVRISALSIMENLKIREMIPILQKGFESIDKVKIQAKKTLANLNTTAVGYLIDAIQKAEDETQKATLIAMLAETGNRRGEDIFFELAKQQQYTTLASTGLKNIAQNSSSILPKIIDALQNKDENVKKTAMKAIDQMRGTSIRNKLQSAMKNTNEKEVKNNIAWLLRHYKSQKDIEFLLEESPKEGAIEAITDMGDIVLKTFSSIVEKEPGKFKSYVHPVMTHNKNKNRSVRYLQSMYLNKDLRAEAKKAMSEVPNGYKGYIAVLRKSEELRSEVIDIVKSLEYSRNSHRAQMIRELKIIASRDPDKRVKDKAKQVVEILESK